MNRQIKCMLLWLPLFLFGCWPSEEELLKEAESSVQSFIDEIRMQNFNSAKDIYPDMSKISRYNIPENFKITSSKFTSDEKNEVKIIGDYGINENVQPLQFVLSKNETGMWKINRTKGLSSYYASDLFNILKTSSCLTNIESDASIHQQCKTMEPKFESLIKQYKENIESSVVVEKSGSHLSNVYNISIRGNIMLKNNSNICIPGRSYEVYILFYDRNGETSHSSKYQFNSDLILANEYHQITLFLMDYHRDYRKYSAVVRITNDQFIRNYLAQHGSINCSELN